MAPKPKLFYSDIIKAKLVIFYTRRACSRASFLLRTMKYYLTLSSTRCRVFVKMISGWMEVDQWISLQLQRFCGSSLLTFENMCILWKVAELFNPGIFYSVKSSINTGVNQAFSVPLLVAMPHLVICEALLLNIFTQVLRIVQNYATFLYLLFGIYNS